MAFYPYPFGHVEVRIDSRDPRPRRLRAEPLRSSRKVR